MKESEYTWHQNKIEGKLLMQIYYLIVVSLSWYCSTDYKATVTTKFPLWSLAKSKLCPPLVAMRLNDPKH